MNSDRSEFRREMQAYAIGLLLALILTAVPFALVAFSGLSRHVLLILICAAAPVQIVVHFRYFLHVDLSRQKREDLQLILFSALILAIMAFGTIWIMISLQARMVGS